MKESTSQATQNPEVTLDFKIMMPIFLVVLIDLLGLTIIIPLLPLYAARFGADPTMIGLLGAAYPVMQSSARRSWAASRIGGGANPCSSPARLAR